MMVHLDPFGGILQRNDQKIQLPLTTMILNNWLNSGSNIHLLAPKINTKYYRNKWHKATQQLRSLESRLSSGTAPQGEKVVP